MTKCACYWSFFLQTYHLRERAFMLLKYLEVATEISFNLWITDLKTRLVPPPPSPFKLTPKLHWPSLKCMYVQAECAMLKQKQCNCLHCHSIKVTWHQPPTSSNNDIIPQVLKQVVNHSCFLNLMKIFTPQDKYTNAS